MRDILQRLFGRRPSFLDDVLEGHDQVRAKEFYGKWQGQEYYTVEMDPAAVNWGKDVPCSLMYFFAEPGRERQDWIVAVDADDEMSSFVFDETTGKVVYVTKEFLGKGASAMFSREYAKLTGARVTVDLCGDDRMVVADSFAAFLDQLENAHQERPDSP